MNIGDLVKHRSFDIYYLVTSIDDSAMIGVMQPQKSTIRYIHREWLELVNENR